MTKILHYIWDPYKIISKNKMDFFIWIVFTIVAGQLGILCNIIIRTLTYKISLQESIYLDSISGSFYTYAIALSASALGPLFAHFVQQKHPKFKSLKIISIIILIMFLFLSGVVYAAAQINSLSSHDIQTLTLDYPQLLIYISSIMIGIYSYCLLKIDSPDYDHLDDTYDENVDKQVEQVVTTSKSISDDGSGVKL